jgi:hypothetical protein
VLNSVEIYFLEMTKETSEAYARRLHEGYFETIFVEADIDIGCGDDPSRQTTCIGIRPREMFRNCQDYHKNCLILGVPWPAGGRCSNSVAGCWWSSRR